MVINVEERPPTEERVSYLEGAYGHLATKADVADARADLRTAIAETETRVTQAVAETETRVIQLVAESETRMTRLIAESETRTTKLIAELRAEIAESQTKATRWMLAIAGFIIAAITLLDRLFG